MSYDGDFYSLRCDNICALLGFKRTRRTGRSAGRKYKLRPAWRGPIFGARLGCDDDRRHDDRPQSWPAQGARCYNITANDDE